MKILNKLIDFIKYKNNTIDPTTIALQEKAAYWFYKWRGVNKSLLNMKRNLWISIGLNILLIGVILVY